MSTPDEVRREALERIFQEHPEWAGKSDSETLRQVQELLDTYQSEIALRHEVEELQRRKFAEEARAAGDQARRARESTLRREREEAARQLAEERQSAASQLVDAGQGNTTSVASEESWLTRHRGIVVFGGVAVLLLTLVGVALAVVLPGQEQGSATSTEPTSEVQTEAPDEEGLLETAPSRTTSGEPADPLSFPENVVAEMSNLGLSCRVGNAASAFVEVNCASLELGTVNLTAWEDPEKWSRFLAEEGVCSYEPTSSESILITQGWLAENFNSKEQAEAFRIASGARASTVAALCKSL